MTEQELIEQLRQECVNFGGFDIPKAIALVRQHDGVESIEISKAMTEAALILQKRRVIEAIKAIKWMKALTRDSLIMSLPNIMLL